MFGVLWERKHVSEHNLYGYGYECLLDGGYWLVDMPATLGGDEGNMNRHNSWVCVCVIPKSFEIWMGSIATRTFENINYGHVKMRTLSTSSN